MIILLKTVLFFNICFFEYCFRTWKLFYWTFHIVTLFVIFCFSFVFLLPQEFHTADPQEFGYEQYIQDANRQYQDCVTLCSRFGWPIEAIFPDPVEPDDCCSSDSRPEADHENQFFEGPLLKMLFTRILQMPYQVKRFKLQVFYWSYFLLNIYSSVTLYDL